MESGCYGMEISMELIHASEQFPEFIRIAFNFNHAFVQSPHGDQGEVEPVSGDDCVGMFDQFSFAVHQHFVFNPEAV